jgi:DNA primase
MPASNRVGLDVKVAKALDTLASRLHVPVGTLDRQFQQIRRAARNQARDRRVVPTTATDTASPSSTPPSPPSPIRIADLDRIDRELLEIVLNEPDSVGRVISRVAVASLRDASLRTILQACYDLHGENMPPTFEHVSRRLGEQERVLAAGLLLPIDPAPFLDRTRQAAWEDRLGATLAKLAERDRQGRMRDLKSALDETNSTVDPVAHRALKTEYLRLLTQRPDTKHSYAS